MSEIDDHGHQQPHPDVLESVAENLNRDFRQDGDEVSRSEMRVLQQRTLADVAWSKHGTAESGELNVSAGLILCGTEGQRKQLVLYVATQSATWDWGVAQMSGAWLEDPPKKPWTGIFSSSRGIWVALGGFAHSPDLGKVRITLADGQAAESVVANESFLMLVPFDAQDLWSSSVTIGYYDVQEREILTESYPLGRQPSRP